MALSSGLHAANLNPAGSLQLVVNRNSVAVSWIVEGSVFSGVGSRNGSYSELLLTEVALSAGHLADGMTDGSSESATLVTGGGTGSQTKVTGGGTGSSVQVTGGGTGSQTKVTGGGTGSSVQVTGGGTGSNTRVTGGGTGSKTRVTGGGTGSSVQVTGGGTGSKTKVTGGGTGSSVQVTGGGTGSAVKVTGGGTGTEAITITLPDGTGMAMEVEMGCTTATVTVLDSASEPVVTFNNVQVIGETGLCARGFDARFRADPGGDFRTK